MLDESRHFFGKQKVFQVLDRMAELKLNVFHWHLTDEPGWRIEIKRYPKLTTVGARGVWEDSTTAPQFYTQEEIREVIRYAAVAHHGGSGNRHAGTLPVRRVVRILKSRPAVKGVGKILRLIPQRKRLTNFSVTY